MTPLISTTQPATETPTGTRRFTHWIGGRAVAVPGRGFDAVVSPADRRVVAELLRGSAVDVDVAVRDAHTAHPDWAQLDPAERGDHLLRIADAVDAHIDDLARLESAETGKPIDVARDEMCGTAEYFRFYGRAVRMMTGQTFEISHDRHLYTRREPYGVVAMITPWNYAVNQAARGIAPALAAGNVVVVKPSEFAATAVLTLAELATDAGLPDGVLNVVLGTGPEVGAPLVAHDLVRRATFTGSVRTGRLVARIAAERLIPVTLELGGKSPHIVFADSDLTKAAAAVAYSIFYNTGQTCSAGSRLLVEASVHDVFVEKVVAEASRLRAGVELGPIITESQFHTVLDYFAVASAEGAVAVLGGAPAADPASRTGRYVEPTIYTQVTTDMRIAQEEIFGPVLVVIPFETESEAVDIANDSAYGLVAGVWTDDLSRAFRLSAQIQAGQVFVNGWGAPIEVPFGGYRDSGIGREKGLVALEEYSQSKSVCMTISPSA